VRARFILLVLGVAVAAAPTSATAALADAEVVLTPVATLSSPVALATRPNDPALYIAEQEGLVQRVVDRQATKILDISERITSGGEQGLLGLTFAADGNTLYVSFTDRRGSLAVKAYGFSEAGKVKRRSGRNIIKVAHPGETNHNGGNIAFGPDGHLYIGTGDGGGGGDPGENAQDLESLLGKILRIDPTRRGGYSIPAGNPFVGQPGRDEIWAYGLRNPWRWSFDRLTGDLWIGDVGQNHWEEIDFQPASSNGGEDYGWDNMEGTEEFEGPVPPNHTPPVFAYPHNGACSVTGGYVYRGSNIPNLQGAYVFGDFCVGELLAFTDPASDLRALNANVGQFHLASFGEDESGELYVLSLGGGVFRIDPAP
jgi:glucose/arabinose dehydrogenase